jgi:C1A family cysteine protease
MRIILLGCLVYLACLANAYDVKDSSHPEVQAAWEQFKQKCGKQYQNQTVHDSKLATFTDNHNKIGKHNVKWQAGIHTYNLSHNCFSDLTSAEFQAIYLTLRRPSTNGNQSNVPAHNQAQPRLRTTAIPSLYDSRTKSLVNPIRDQGYCGSCWAYASTATIEAARAIKTGTLPQLSEQVLIDCDTSNQGCNGGWPTDALKYGEKPGLPTLAAYPDNTTSTVNGIAGKCQSTSATTYPITSFQDFGYCGSYPNGCNSGQGSISVSTVQQMVMAHGVLATTMYAGDASFQSYSSGIFTPTIFNSRRHGLNCEQDHAVNIIGWGNSSQGSYFIMRNSWGKSWGMAGYFQLPTSYITCLGQDVWYAS